jgi:versiconal hemiacetal acetate reductase
MAEVAIAWALKKGTNPICGLNSKERIDEAVTGAKLQLTDEDINKLDSPYVSKAVIGY